MERKPGINEIKFIVLRGPEKSVNRNNGSRVSKHCLKKEDRQQWRDVSSDEALKQARRHSRPLTDKTETGAFDNLQARRITVETSKQ